MRRMRRTNLLVPGYAGARSIFLLVVLVLGAGALVEATAALAGPAVSYTVPVSETRANPCTGELILITGQQHVDVNENVSASGTIQSHVMFRLDGVTAVGLVTGKQYVVQETDNHEFVLGGQTSEETFDTTFHYVRLGEDGTPINGDDFYLSYKAHFSLNPNGGVSVTHDFGDEPCQ